MNKSTWVMIVVLLTALTGTSHAATTFDFFKMVGATEVSGGSAASQSATARSTYNLSETPYLYYHVSTPISANVFTFWLSPLNSSSMVTDTVSTSDSEGWLSLSNWNTLPANQK
ncbi:MAG: hypothetical protein HGA80_08420, partial [Candidatus Omnitrophica bacterium]|nr:hypothetical protein [Candidatus Omnitrophota bacterium]